MTRTISAPDKDLGPSFAVVEGLEAVRQLVVERLHFIQGEWFLSDSAGIPYYQEIFSQPASDDLAVQAIASEIRAVADVTSVEVVASAFDPDTRRLRFQATVGTLYGDIMIEEAL